MLGTSKTTRSSAKAQSFKLAVCFDPAAPCCNSPPPTCQPRKIHEEERPRSAFFHPAWLQPSCFSSIVIMYGTWHSTVTLQNWWQSTMSSWRGKEARTFFECNDYFYSESRNKNQYHAKHTHLWIFLYLYTSWWSTRSDFVLNSFILLLRSGCEHLSNKKWTTVQAFSTVHSIILSISWNDQKSIKVKFWVPLSQQIFRSYKTWSLCLCMNEIKTDSFISNSLALEWILLLFNRLLSIPLLI